MLPRVFWGPALMVLAMACFASMDAASKWMIRDHSTAQLMWIRYGFYCVFVFILVRKQGVVAAMRTNRPWLQGGRALLATVEAAAFVLAFRYLPLADAHALGSASPLIVVALAGWLLGERVGWHRALAVVAGFAGVLVIIRPGFSELSWPLLIPLTAAFMWALYQVLLRLCARTDHSDTTLLWSSVIGLAVTTLVGPFYWTPMAAIDWVWMAVISALGAVAHLALTKAMQFGDASALQPYSYTLLVWVAVMGIIFYGDFPDGWTLLGAAIIVASGLYTWHRDRVDPGDAQA